MLSNESFDLEDQEHFFKVASMEGKYVAKDDVIPDAGAFLLSVLERILQKENADSPEAVELSDLFAFQVLKMSETGAPTGETTTRHVFPLPRRIKGGKNIQTFITDSCNQFRYLMVSKPKYLLMVVVREKTTYTTHMDLDHKKPVPLDLNPAGIFDKQHTGEAVGRVTAQVCGTIAVVGHESHVCRAGGVLWECRVPQISPDDKDKDIVSVALFRLNDE